MSRRRSELLTICVGALLLTAAGCAFVGAARRSQSVKQLQLGMMPREVLQVAGEPQRKEDVTTSEGPVEVWSYLIYDGGYWKRYSIGFSEGRLVSLGMPATEQAGKPAAAQVAEPRAQPRLPEVGDPVYQAYVAAYLQGYQKGEHDRDAVWTEAIARLVPETERALKQREALAFVAGHDAAVGEERTKSEMQRAWEEYRAARTPTPP